MHLQVGIKVIQFNIDLLFTLSQVTEIDKTGSGNTHCMELVKILLIDILQCVHFALYIVHD